MKEWRREQTDIGSVLDGYVFEDNNAFNPLDCYFSGDFILFLSGFPGFCTLSFDDLRDLAEKMAQRAKMANRFLPDPDS